MRRAQVGAVPADTRALPPWAVLPCRRAADPPVKFVLLSPQQLPLDEPLPFNLYDLEGQLLLAAHHRLDDPVLRAQLVERAELQEVQAEERELADWRRRLGQAVLQAMQRNVPLGEIARVRAAQGRAEAGAALVVAPGEEWSVLVGALESALREAHPERDWLERVERVRQRLRRLSTHRFDEALCHLIYQGGRHADSYSSHQSLRCMLVAGEAARALGWDEPRVVSLESAALTMNVAMRQLQDTLARAGAEVDVPARVQIARHAAEGARLLADSGLADTLWLEAVRLHHHDGLRALPLSLLSPAQQLAVLLRRVDIFCAKLSRRSSRGPMNALQAAREACLGTDGRPDDVGAALLKAVGLYPPGSFVELASGERGVVRSRGARADQPLVAALTNAQGLALGEPVLRDTAQPRFAVRGAVHPDTVRVQPPLAKLMALRRA